MWSKNAWPIYSQLLCLGRAHGVPRTQSKWLWIHISYKLWNSEFCCLSMIWWAVAWNWWRMWGICREFQINSKVTVYMRWAAEGNRGPELTRSVIDCRISRTHHSVEFCRKVPTTLCVYVQRVSFFGRTMCPPRLFDRVCISSNTFWGYCYVFIFIAMLSNCKQKLFIFCNIYR